MTIANIKQLLDDSDKYNSIRTRILYFLESYIHYAY